MDLNEFLICSNVLNLLLSLNLITQSHGNHFPWKHLSCFKNMCLKQFYNSFSRKGSFFFDWLSVQLSENCNQKLQMFLTKAFNYSLFILYFHLPIKQTLQTVFSKCMCWLSAIFISADILQSKKNNKSWTISINSQLNWFPFFHRSYLNYRSNH